MDYNPSNQPLTIKLVSDTGYEIILSDGSRWQKMKTSSFHSEYTPGAVVKVMVPMLQGLKSQSVFTIEIQNKDHSSDHWYFDGYVKK